MSKGLLFLNLIFLTVKKSKDKSLKANIFLYVQLSEKSKEVAVPSSRISRMFNYGGNSTIIMLFIRFCFLRCNINSRNNLR